MNRKLLMMACLLCLAACTNRRGPAEIISKDSMKYILWDMMRADEMAMNQSIKDTGKPKKQYNIAWYNQVFALHHITREQFYKSYHYYLAHPDENKMLTDSLGSYAERVLYPPLPKPSVQRK